MVVFLSSCVFQSMLLIYSRYIYCRLGTFRYENENKNSHRHAGKFLTMLYHENVMLTQAPEKYASDSLNLSSKSQMSAFVAFLFRTFVAKISFMFYNVGDLNVDRGTCKIKQHQLQVASSL